MSIYVITYNRQGALSALLDSFARHGISYDGIIDDGSSDTRFLEELANGSEHAYDAQIDSDVFTLKSGQVIVLGRSNVGVAGNSNRALELFRRGKSFHVCLCNDDILATGKFHEGYYKAHKLGAGMLCFTPKIEKTNTVGKFRVSPKIYGAMISITRDVFDRIGFFDTSFGKFGHEHCDYTHRARIVGAMGRATAIDVIDPMLELQEVRPSIGGIQRQNAEARSEEKMADASGLYFVTSPYRDFTLEQPRTTGVNGIGITFGALQNASVVRS